MKKFLLLASSMLLFSCASNEELETKDSSKLSEAKLELFKKGSKESPSTPSTFKCGSSSFTNPINVNPNYPYISNYEVFYTESTGLWGTNQIYLTNFLAKQLFPGSTDPWLTPGTNIYIGESSYGDFMGDPSNFDYMQEYGFGQDSDNVIYYGDMFPYDQPMTDDAANTVYHALKTHVDSWTSQGKKIVAVQLFTQSLLCIPGGKTVIMRLKVSN